MDAMLSALRSERLKYRRTFVPWLAVLAPLAVCLFSWLPHILASWPVAWVYQLVIIGNWWPVLWVPFGTALLAALAAWYDASSQSWRTLRARRVAPATLYGAKLLVVAGYALLSSTLLLVVTLVMGKLVVWSEPVPWATLLLATLVPWAAGLPVLAIQLWLATAKGFGAAFALAVLGFVAGIAAAEQPAWICVPWAWAIRSTVPVVGAHANGLPLEPGSPLWDGSAIGLAAGLGLALALLVGMAGAAWFARQEVRS